MNPQEKIQEGIQMAQKIYEVAAEYLVKYGFQVLGGIIILLIGWKLSQWVGKLFENYCHKKHFDVTLTKFLSNIVRGLVMVFALLMSLEKFGVTISPLIASVSALIFGASFAIQAPLSNYAAGLMVILTRPFVVGNTISVQGVHGVVEEVKLPCTILITEDGEKITIPNKEIVGQILYNSAEYKVVEKSVGISYGDDPEKAVKVILDTLAGIARVTKTPAPLIGIESFGESSIVIAMRYWVPTKEYFHVMYEANLAIFNALKKAGITIPFPQREVRMLSK